MQLPAADREMFTPVVVGIAMIKTAHDLYPDQFQRKQEAYEYEFDKNPFDLVSGTDKIRKAIEEGIGLKEIEESWGADLEAFGELRNRYLLY